jgi:hypothetical protein
MKRITRPVAVAATAALALLGLGTASQAATGSATEYDTEGTTLTVTTTAPDVTLKRGDITQFWVTIAVSASDAFSLDTDNSVTLESTTGYGFEYEPFQPVDATHQRALVTLDADAPTGKWYVGVSVSADVSYWDSYFGAYDTNWVWLLRDAVTSFTVNPAPVPVAKTTYLTTNAGPEPVTVGKNVTVKGSLKYRTASGAIAALPNRVVKMYFNPATAGLATTYVGSATTTSTGAYAKAFKATRSGTWIAKYAGSATTFKASLATDYVKAVR